MFLTWTIGSDEAERAIQTKSIVEEDLINPFPERVSTAITEGDVEKDLPLFRDLFTNDAWEAVIALSM